MSQNQNLIQNFKIRHGIDPPERDKKKPSKRTRYRGEGSFRVMPKGWEYTISLGIDSQGKRIRAYFYGRTKAECLEKSRSFLKNYDPNTTSTKTYRLKSWLTHWIEKYKKSVAANTKQNYIRIINKYIIPEIGNMWLHNIKTYHVQEMLDKIDISKSTRMWEIVRSIMRDALNCALRLNLVDINAAQNLNLPVAKTARPGRAMTQAHQKLFEESIKNNPYKALLLCYLYTGMRRGEALALKWQDIEFKQKIIYINGAASKNYNGNGEVEYNIHSPKTPGSIRTVPLHEKLAEALQELPRDAELVFHKNGKLLNIDKPSKIFREATKAVGLSYILKDCRNTFSTRCSEAGVPPKTIQAWLGHTNINTTMDIYAKANTEIFKRDLAKFESLKLGV